MTTDPRGGDEADDLRAVLRATEDRLDERPSATVRATVLAAAARAVDAKPRDAASPIVARTRRWPMSVAAVLVVSVIAGLVATRALHEAPERTATATPDAAVTVARADAVAAAPAEPTAPPAAAMPQASRSAAKKQAPEPRAAASVARDPRPAPRPPAEHLPAAPAPEPEPRREAAAAPSGIADAAEAGPEDKQEATRARMQAPRLAFPDRAAAKALTPQAWVERIVALRRAGRADDADRELDALRRHYPDFAIPADALAPTGTR